jgi:hypothetical protein
MPQGRRNRVLQGLRNRQLRVLVATDVAARGIDVPSISHVINYGLPMKAEDYVHRIGRTGRAGRNGLAVTLAERMDVGMIRRIQQFTTQAIPAAAIEGLEPKSPEPRIHAGRPSGDFGGPSTVAGLRSTTARAVLVLAAATKSRFAPRRDEGGFGHGRHEGFAPRRDDGFAPRRDAAPRDVHPGRETPFTKRSEGSFVPNRPAFDNAAPRKAFDRAPGHRPAGAPAFAPRKASGPGGAPRPAGKGGPFKPQRPRQGGFDR